MKIPTKLINIQNSEFAKKQSPVPLVIKTAGRLDRKNPLTQFEKTHRNPQKCNAFIKKESSVPLMTELTEPIEN